MPWPAWLLVLLAGPCTGLQYPLQYLYRYEAEVSADIPEINEHHKATSYLKANLTVYVTSPSTVAFQLEDVEFLECHNCSYSESGNTSEDDPNEQFQAASDEPASFLGRYSFGIDENGHFVHHADEKLWVVNFYKSIAGLFNISPLRRTFLNTHNQTHEGAYAELEETVMGACQSTYTEHRLAGVDLAQYQLRNRMQDDPQLSSECKETRESGQSSRRRRWAIRARRSEESGALEDCDVPGISDTVTRVLRSVNFEECSKVMEYQFTMHGVQCSLADDQCGNVFSRSSNGVYFVRGNRTSMRLEQAEVEGSVIVSPFGYRTELLRTLTKQKVRLVSVQKLASPHPQCPQSSCVSSPSMLGSFIDGLTANLYSSNEQSSANFSMWEINGLGITEEERSGVKDLVVRIIHEAKTSLESGNISRIAMAGVSVDMVGFFMMDFNTSELLDTINSIPPEEHDLMFGVLANLGYDASVAAFLEMVKAGQVSDVREFLFVASLNNNLKSSAALRPLLDHIKSKKIDDHPFTTSQILINFATLVSRVCVGPGNNRTDTVVVFAQEQCRQNKVLQDFQDFIIQQLETATEFWKQLVYVKTLVSLKTVEATNALLPYALGRVECDAHVRTVALEALASWNAPIWSASSKDQQRKITLILLDVLENPAELPTIRARALAFLASWPLSSTVWSRLALATKRPGLRDLSALIYSLIKSTSEYEHPEAIRQRQLAKHALVIAESSSPEECLSSFKTWHRYGFKDQAGALDYTMLFKDPSSPLPSELSLYAERSLAGLIFYERMDFMMSNKSGDWSQIARALFDQNATFSGRNISSFFLTMMRNNLSIDERVRGVLSGLVSFFPLRAAKIFVPLQPKFTMDLLKTISGEDNSLKSPGTFYMNPSDYLLIAFNDLGLMFVTSASQPTLYHFNGSLKFSMGAPHSFTVSSSDLYQLYTSGLRVNTWSITPWTRSKVSSGITQSTVISLPVSPTLVLRTKDSEGYNAGFNLTLNMTQSKQKLFVMKNSMPHTVQGDTSPSDFDAMAGHFKVIRPAGLGAAPYQKTWYNPESTFYLNYKGDSPLQLDFNALMEGNFDDLEKYMAAAPNLKEFVFVGGQSEAHNMTFVLSLNKDHRERKNGLGSYVSKYGKDSYEEDGLCDYSRGNMPEGSQQDSPGRPLFQFGDLTSPQLASFLQKLQDSAGWPERIDGYNIRGEMWKYSQLVSSFEGVLATSTCYALPDQKAVKTVVVFQKDDDLKICVETNSTAPKVNEFSVTSKFFEQNLTKEMQVEVWTGAACDTRIMSQNHTYSVSTDGLAELRRDADQTGHRASEAQPHLLQAVHDSALYDTMQILTDVADRKNWEKISTFFGTNVVALWEMAVMKVFGTAAPRLGPQETHSVQNLTVRRHKDGCWRMVSDDRVTSPGCELPEFADNWPKIGYQAADFPRADYCVIKADSIKTYDGFFTNASVESCPVLATTLCEGGRAEDAFGITVQKEENTGLVATISSERYNFSISVGAAGVQVNNDTWKSEIHFSELNSTSGVVYGQVYGRDGFYKVEILDSVEVMYMKSAVYIKADDRFKGYLCGLCGDHNGEPGNDLKTPEGCLLTNPGHFLSSWKPTSGFQCVTERHVDPSSCIKEEPLSHDYYAQYQLV